MWSSLCRYSLALGLWNKLYLQAMKNLFGLIYFAAAVFNEWRLFTRAAIAFSTGDLCVLLLYVPNGKRAV